MPEEVAWNDGSAGVMLNGTGPGAVRQSARVDEGHDGQG